MPGAAGQGDKVEFNSDAELGANTARAATVSLGVQTTTNVRLGVFHGVVGSPSIPDFS
jgi:hypothetical protein